MSGSPEGFTVTSSRVGFALSLAAVGALVWQGFTFVQSGTIKDIEQDTSLAQLERSGDRFANEVRTLNKSVNELKIEITRLTTVFEAYIQKAELQNGSTFARIGK